jgi:hypothetical protein
MNWTHWLTAFVVLAIGYWLGTKYPGWLTKGTGGIVTG